MFKTPLGLRDPRLRRASRARPTPSGSTSTALRYGSVILSGMLAGAGRRVPDRSASAGARYNENVTAGRGFIALAALIFGNWRPFGAFDAALLFGFSTALAFRLPVYSETAATAVPGAAVRDHADRRRRRDRPIDSARSRWPPVRQAVTTGPGRAPPGRRVASGGSSRRRRDPGRHSDHELPERLAAHPCRAIAVPVAAVVGFVAIRLARRARRRLGADGQARGGGACRRRLGRILGWLGLYFALIGAIALAFTTWTTTSCRRLESRCSRSATASARLVSGRGSTSSRSSSRRRSAASTSAPWKTSSSGSCPRRRTSRASSARTRDHLGLDGQLYVDEFQLALRARRARGRGVSSARSSRASHGPGRGGGVPEQGGLDHAGRDRRAHGLRRSSPGCRAGSGDQNTVLSGQHDAEEESDAEAERPKLVAERRQGRGVRRRLTAGRAPGGRSTKARSRAGQPPVRRPTIVGLRVRAREPEAEVGPWPLAS